MDGAEPRGCIVVVGLGPGDPGLLTTTARDWLTSGHPVWLRTRIHPTVAALPGAACWQDFDSLYRSATDFATLYDTIVARLIELAQAATGPIVYAVPGHPTIGESTVARLRASAPAAGLTLQIVPGLSFLDVIAPLLPVDPLGDNLQIVDGLELAAALDREPFGGGALPITPLRPALIGQVYNQAIASAVKLALGRLYPDDHPVTMLQTSGVADAATTRSLPLYQLDHQADGAVDHLTSLYLPSLAPERATRTAEGLQAIMARLRAPGGCPWDREQTHQSILSSFVEEIYEAIDALNDGDLTAFRDEIGDVLLHVYFHAQMAEEAGEFTLEDVYDAIAQKLLRRHPHVFGDVTVSGSGDVVRNWDQIKAAERQAKGNGDSTTTRSALDAIPRSLPALARTVLAQSRVVRLLPTDEQRSLGESRAAFDEAVIVLRERLDHADHGMALTAQIGAVLFALADLARQLDLDPEAALHLTLTRFGTRYRTLEAALHADGRKWSSVDQQEIAGLWPTPGDDTTGS